ncbi:MAG TPA: ABC transporter permease [Bryobacteraceae bacterium]|jgi:putative ABC transport system permease protein
MSRTLRSLSHDPALLLSATLTLAVCIAANTTLFSVANSILVRPLPYPGADRIDWISEIAGPAQQDIGTAPDYFRLRDGNRVFEAVAAYNPVTTTWTRVEQPEQLDTARVSASFFRVMATQPLKGRYFAADEDRPHAPDLAVLSYAFWQSGLGGDPNVVGKTMELDRKPHTIIGVMPQGFDYPRGTRIWLPSQIDEAAQKWLSPSRPIFTVSILARRRPDVTPAQVQADLNRMAGMLRDEYHVFPTKFRWDLVVAARPLQEHMTGSLRQPLLALSGAAGLVLLIACVNLANLMLARAGTRQRELAVRLALGATRSRIAGQILTESLLLAVPGGISGILLAGLGVRLLNATKPAMLIHYPPITMDLRVLAFTTGLTLAAALLFGFAPALSATAVRIHESLKAGGMTHSGGPASTRLRKLLLVGELSVSLILLIGAGLLARTFINLARIDLGFRTDHLLTFRLNQFGPADHDYAAYYATLLDRMRQLPMVQSAALATDIPLRSQDFYIGGRIRVAGRAMVPFSERPVIGNTLVSPEFFRTLGIPLRSGRVFEERDAIRSAPLTNYGAVTSARVVVNQAFVRKLFPAEDPLNKQIVFGPDQNSLAWTIVGVVGDIRGGTLGADPPPMVYRCICEGSRVVSAGFILRTSGDPKGTIHAVEQEIRSVDRDQPIIDVRTMDDRRALSLTPERFQLTVIGIFACIAMLLAAAGVYGVTSYLVARRTREIGVRVALGARPADVVAMVLRETMILVGFGAAGGLAGAWALTRYIRSMLYGVTAVDSLTFCLAPLLLMAIVLCACAAPARSAAQIDPTRALREE